MTFKPKLFSWLMRSAWLPNAIAAVISTAWIVLSKRPLYETWMEGALFISLHAFCVVACFNWLGANRRQLPYLYTRGYSRNTLWAHHVMAAIASACFVLVPAAAIVVGPMRSKMQELMNNPAYPFVAERDIAVLPAWTLAYAVAFAAFHYAWIRLKQPTTGGPAGIWLIPVAAIAFGWFGDFSWGVPGGGWLSIFGVALAASFVAILGIGARKLHQNIELH
jgi:hypothetical protein